MDLFAGILPFVHVAQERSFRRAAERLGVSTAAVSKAVQKLETDLGVRLLERTSRQVALTSEGEAFLERAREAVAQVHAARELVAQAQRAPRGPLTVTLPYILGPLLLPRLARLQARHPGLTLHVRLGDRLSRLVDEQIDVALRIGELEDSSLVGQLLLRTRWVTLASPAYLARHGTPQHPDALVGHQCLKFILPRGTAREWVFRRGSGPLPGARLHAGRAGPGRAARRGARGARRRRTSRPRAVRARPAVGATGARAPPAPRRGAAAPLNPLQAGPLRPFPLSLRERDGVRVSGEPGLNPLSTPWATGWRTGPGTLTLTLSRGERE